MEGKGVLRSARRWAFAFGVVAASAGGTHIALEHAGGPADAGTLGPFSTEAEQHGVVDVGDFKLSGTISSVETSLIRGASLPAPVTMEAIGHRPALLRLSGALVDGSETEIGWTGRGVLSIERGVELVLDGSSNLTTTDGRLRVEVELSALRISTGVTRLTGDLTIAGPPTKSLPRPTLADVGAADMTVAKATQTSGSGAVEVTLGGPSLVTLEAPVTLSGDFLVSGGGRRSPQRTRQVEVLSGIVALAIGHDGSLSLAETFTGKLELREG